MPKQPENSAKDAAMQEQLNKVLTELNKQTGNTEHMVAAFQASQQQQQQTNQQLQQHQLQQQQQAYPAPTCYPHHLLSRSSQLTTATALQQQEWDCAGEVH